MRFLPLSEFPRYIATKYNLRPEKDVELKFFYESSNLTQKGREQFHVWHYAQFMSMLIEKTYRGNMHIAILTPIEDRGVDCYIRLFDVDSRRIIGIPIQVIEIRFAQKGKKDPRLPVDVHDTSLSGKNVDKEPENVIMTTVENAKFKAGPSGQETLLCALLPTARTPLNVMKLRDLFENRGEWPYSQIVFTHTENGAFLPLS